MNYSICKVVKATFYNWISITNVVKILVCIPKQNQQSFAMSVDGLKDENGASTVAVKHGRRIITYKGV